MGVASVNIHSQLLRVDFLSRASDAQGKNLKLSSHPQVHVKFDPQKKMNSFGPVKVVGKFS